MARDTNVDEGLLAAIGSGLLDYAREVEGRDRGRRQLGVFELDADIELAAPLPRGSMLAVLGTDRSTELTELRAAAEARDAESLDRALQALAERSQGARRPGSLADVPVVSEVDYRGKTVATGLPLMDPTDVAVASLVFAGGAFDKDGFGATSLFTSDGRSIGEAVQGVLIVRQPQLSPAERALLGRLSEADLNATVAPPYATTIFVVAVTLTSGAFPFQDPALTDAIRSRFPNLEWPPPSPPDPDPKAVDESIRAWLESPDGARELEALDARAAVESLVQLRQDILRGKR